MLGGRKGSVDAVIASATDAIVTSGEDGRILTWNAAAERIFGYEASEVVGESLTTLMPERFRELHRAGHARVVETGETRVIGQTVQLAGLRRDGTEFPIELSLSTWTTNGRRFFAGIIRDVSERERLSRELAESQERLHAILRSANDAIICADTEGLVTMWNPAAERLLGHAEADMLGKPLTAIIPDRFREQHIAGVNRAAAGGEPRVIGRTVELAALRADGTEFPVELSLSTWTTNEKRYFAGIIRDISERKRAEEEIREASEALAEKNQQLEALSAKLAKYLSRQLYESIFSGRTDVHLQSYRKKLTIFFSDIQGFTELTDSMEAEPLSELLNEYLSEMAAIAGRHGGTIDKFIGDGVMIFFGDPETRGEKEDAIACVEMALEMRERVHELQNVWQNRGVARPLHIRIGINTGYATVGNFGSEDRLDYTIVGGQVNVASRLEARAEPDEILISHQTYALVNDTIDCRPVGEIKVKGIAYPLETYRVIGHRMRESDSPAIDEERRGFRLILSPALLSATDIEDARSSLRHALEALDDDAGQAPEEPTSPPDAASL
jgi:adenylate cyclase